MSNSRPKNSFIQSIAPNARKSFVADLDCVDIGTLEFISKTGMRLRNTCFPIGSVISMQYTSNAKTMEVYAVGREGVLTDRVLIPAYQRRFDFKCQIAGSMLYMPREHFDYHVERSDALREAIVTYSGGVTNFLAQSVACAGLHTVAQRCARWLLTTVDRVGSNEFALTHELLASMLGVRRAGISVALARLAGLSIVQYRLGKFKVLDQLALERESCECYRAVRRR